MILLDASVLVEGLGAGGKMRKALRSAIANRERMALPALVLYEWLRGPRLPEEVEAQETLLPSSTCIPIGPDESALAADLYYTVTRPRGREIDLVIAATALVWDATLWTLNTSDFTDIPGLRLRGEIP